MKDLINNMIFLFCLFGIAPAAILFILYAKGIEQEATKRANAVEQRIETFNKARRGN